MDPSQSSDSSGVMTDATDNTYLRDAVMTASPEQLQLMLYDGAIRYARQGRDAIEAKDFETSFDRLTKAQNIILEMSHGLNHEINPTLCKQVASIYDFLYRKLVDANLYRDVSAIDDALKVLAIERETWQMLVDKVAKAREANIAIDPLNDAPTEGVLTSGFSVEG